MSKPKTIAEAMNGAIQAEAVGVPVDWRELAGRIANSAEAANKALEAQLAHAQGKADGLEERLEEYKAQFGELEQPVQGADD